MKRHRATSAVSISTGNEDGAVASVANPTPTAVNQNAHTQSALAEPHLKLASVNIRTHTLVLTGELDHRSAHSLEAAIERLCEDGVTGITLDLRELTYIDPIGVAVIAFRSGLCKRRGYDFALIPGSQSIQKAFDRAGVSDLLPFQEDELKDDEGAQDEGQEDEVSPPRLPALVLGHRSRDECEQG
jgi:anti-anti-sigma factor